MTVSPLGERSARPPRFPQWWALLPLVLLLNAALGYSIVTALLSPSDGDPVAVERGVRDIPAAPVVAGVTTVTASPAEFTKVTGLEVLRVATSGAGGIIDLRYRVMDEKLAAFHVSHQVVPAIIDSKTGKALATQWMGHAHPPSSFLPDRNYWMLFLNPNDLVERGNRVAVRMGHAKLTGVRVR